MCIRSRGINIMLLLVVAFSRDILVHLSNNDFIFLFKIFERGKGVGYMYNGIQVNVTSL